MKSDGEAPSDALAFDPSLVLLKDDGALLDPRFLGALQGEIEAQVGRHAAMPILFQIGFLNGLRDAYRVMDAAFERDKGQAPARSALAMSFRVLPGQGPRGSLEITGAWPERSEASARLARDGRSRECSCFVSAGYTSGWLSGTLEANILAVETGCSVTGAEGCRFVAREVEGWRNAGNARAAATLESVSFDSFRAVARAHLEPPQTTGSRQAQEAVDRDAAVVHIWGPVMVIPYSGGDEALQAVELIGNDPSARGVSVVVVDLAGTLLDDAFGALALERIVETAESWGAETLLAGVSSLSEKVLQDLARPPLLVCKDLDEAIALAFQIARSQRTDQ